MYEYSFFISPSLFNLHTSLTYILLTFINVIKCMWQEKGKYGH